MTDAQRINSINKILDMLHHPKHRDNGTKQEILINRTRNYPGITETSTEYERFFAISGQDVYDSGYQWSCGTVAKTFCYLNSILPENEQLDLKIMISTHPDHLIDSMVNHTLPCVKMGDGKWYAIEPQRDIIDNRPRHPNYPDVPFIMDEIKVGNKVHHILENLIDTPYEIMAVMSWPEYTNKCSDFGTFLKYGARHDKKTKMLVATIEKVLEQINTNGQTGGVYTFCKLMHTSKLPIKVIKPRGTNYNMLLLNINGEAYTFGTNHKYLMMHKLENEIEQEWTLGDYIKWFEENIIKHDNEHK
ncbi:MAG: hypothetical protein IKA25_03415 [Alphaproteobacteria bacterium]|nr:hypothetical protein [Alphaproteobacteria bacterium]